ncbi:uncharacterized protein CC84DRAFT_867674 [Paraphaeosphaeria sporulosa]|uniref:Uncharacterized protein n=1 Tax=Paraphaeosphaeria sporulosa TaxID=1460663 RepID=A0A177CAM5_9PLEO|nr:uncharacterized protein CC84DRAFT_867674 [Paraphaeosphaeria sporulosa]OAG03817.1 hypothetical protein CC84DRAFT_867674 [Paraphaeosphaeria sporulosa]
MEGRRTGRLRCRDGSEDAVLKMKNGQSRSAWVPEGFWSGAFQAEAVQYISDMGSPSQAKRPATALLWAPLIARMPSRARAFVRKFRRYVQCNLFACAFHACHHDPARPPHAATQQCAHRHRLPSPPLRRRRRRQRQELGGSVRPLAVSRQEWITSPAGVGRSQAADTDAIQRRANHSTSAGRLCSRTPPSRGTACDG